MNIDLEHKFPFLVILFALNGISAIFGSSEGIQVYGLLFGLLLFTVGALFLISAYALRKRSIWAYKVTIMLFVLVYLLFALVFYYHESLEFAIENKIFIIVFTAIYILIHGAIIGYVYNKINNSDSTNGM